MSRSCQVKSEEWRLRSLTDMEILCDGFTVIEPTGLVLYSTSSNVHQKYVPNSSSLIDANCSSLSAALTAIIARLLLGG